MILNSESIKLKGVADPEQTGLNNIRWDVLQGQAEIDSQGNLTVNEFAELNDEILVMATIDNPNYGKEFPNYSGSVNTTAETFSDTISLTNNYRMPLKSLTIDGGDFDYNGSSFKLNAVPLPNRSDYAPVTWEIVSGGSFASIDNDGNLSINNNVTSKQQIAVKATSNVDNSISAIALINAQYSEPVQYDIYGEPINPDVENSVVIRPIANYGGTYVDFHAYRTPLLKNTNHLPIDPLSSIDGSVTWELADNYRGNAHFGENGERNRLFLDPNVNGVQGMVVICKLEKEVNGNTILLGKKEYYCEFTYDSNIAPITGIRVKPNFTMTFEGGAVLTTDSQGNITFDATKDVNRKQCCLQAVEKYLVEPKEPAPEGKHYDFDPTKVKFSHADGNFDSKLCTLSQAPYVRTEFDKDDGLTQETWYINYPMIYEDNNSTRKYNYDSTLGSDGRYLKVTYPRNRMTITTNVTILRPKKVMDTNDESTIVYIYCGNTKLRVIEATSNENGNIVYNETNEGEVKKFETNVPGVPIDGVSFGIKNQNGHPICNTNNQEATGLYTVIQGNSYCHVNPLGSDMRIMNAASVNYKDVILKVTVLDKTAYAKIQVKLS